MYLEGRPGNISCVTGDCNDQNISKHQFYFSSSPMNFRMF